jgi:hypothetical protein
MTRILPRNVTRGIGVLISFLLGAAVPAAFAGAVLTLGVLVNVSGPVLPFPAPTCNGAAQTGKNFPSAEVEPYVDIDPSNPNNLVGVWQQDRWSNGGSNGLRTGVSHDGGQHWTIPTPPTFARCEGGTVANGGDYERASDPWVSIAPNGDAYQVSLSFNDSNTTSAVLVSKSATHGNSWNAPVTLKRDTEPTVFNDKESVTADPTDPAGQHVYAVWDRLVFPEAHASAAAAEHAIGFRGPAWFSRTTNGGASWEPARIIFDPGEQDQTIGNQIVVMPNGTLVDGFNLIFNHKNVGGERGFNVAVIRSTDKGLTWSDPIIVAKLLAIPVTDPNTGQPVRTGDILPSWAADPSSGKLFVVWQDARFSGFAHDDIAFSMSTDGGLTWSEPVKINKTPVPTHAFTATIRVAPDGRIAVSYYDFRFLSATNTATLPTDYWIVNCLARCADPTQWTEQHLAGSFDMKLAPVARGFFVGDYEGLGSSVRTTGTGTTIFQPFFVQTVSSSNPSDVFTRTAETPTAH